MPYVMTNVALFACFILREREEGFLSSMLYPLLWVYVMVFGLLLGNLFLYYNISLLWDSK